jgi:small subunit ribosomal protein S16
MALKIRLARRGAKKRPFYHIVAADVRSPRDGKYLEKLGTYNPLLEDKSARVNMIEDRIKHWLSQGAQPTERVAKFLGAAGIIDMPKVTDKPQKSKPKAKAVMMAEEKAEKLKAAAEAAEEAKAAAKAEAEAPAPVEEAPAEETKTEEAAPAAEEAPAEEEKKEETA